MGDDRPMTRTIVLVHGAWGGSYGFRSVRRLLNAQGFEVLTPSLTGIGERSHLAHPGICLDTHVTDVVNTVLYDDLDDFVLLGFSYGGMVVTGALAHIGERVSDLVYLDAFVPGDGESAQDLVGVQFGDERLALGADWAIPPVPRELDDQELADWSNARRSLQPVKTFAQPVSLPQPLDSYGFSRTYVKATADPNEHPQSAFWRAARVAEASPAWDYHEISTNHMVPLTHPTELAVLLADLASAGEPAS